MLPYPAQAFRSSPNGEHHNNNQQTATTLPRNTCAPRSTRPSPRHFHPVSQALGARLSSFRLPLTYSSPLLPPPRHYERAVPPLRETWPPS